LSSGEIVAALALPLSLKTKAAALKMALKIARMSPLQYQE
jgi:hypothetical protein